MVVAFTALRTLLKFIIHWNHKIILLHNKCTLITICTLTLLLIQTTLYYKANYAQNLFSIEINIACKISLK